ncbi:MAG: tetratricopeptide repeat protein [Cyanobacteria bacterium J06623_4]
MSEAELFTELANMVDVDPFALLGVSVSADEKRIAKRYRYVAKQLHPDALSGAADCRGLTQTLAAQVIARIVNPSYQKLKHENSRQETLATLRFRVRRLVRTEKLVPTFPNAQQLALTPEDAVDVFYEQALTHLAKAQFGSIDDLYTHSLEIGQLNLIYLRRKMADLVIRPKRAGLITNAVTPTVSGNTIGSVRPINTADGPSTGAIPAEKAPTINYVAKHTSRAKTYLTQKNYEMAVQELREALKLMPQSPEIHSMLGQAYYKQKLSGMAKAHFRQALKLKPGHKVAQKYGKLLGLSDEPPNQPNQPPETNKSSKAPDSSAGPAANASPEAPPTKRAWLGRLLKR